MSLSVVQVGDNKRKGIRTTTRDGIMNMLIKRLTEATKKHLFMSVLKVLSMSVLMSLSVVQV